MGQCLGYWHLTLEMIYNPHEVRGQRGYGHGCRDKHCQPNSSLELFDLGLSLAVARPLNTQFSRFQRLRSPNSTHGRELLFYCPN